MSSRVLRSFVSSLVLVAACALPASAFDLSGCWTGSWQSCTTGHSGVLRARFTKCGETQYRVDFSGRFCKLLPFRYSVTLDVVEDCGDRVALAGSSYLGRMFGTFGYTASADGSTFTANYTSKKDAGRFELRRRGS
ncbi:MAG: hypothetical protein ACK6CT_07755 [Planctomycetia bacterium]|jgi:hypothetical protein